jgi:hypothetical protein
MGYDMTIENPDSTEDAGLAAAKQEFNATVAEREQLNVKHDDPAYQAAQAKVDEAYKAMSAAHTTYFRLNIWGMSRYCDAMYDLGMVIAGNGHPPFPKLPDGITWEDVEAVEYPADHEGETAKPEAVAHHAAHEAVLAWHAGEPQGIELHKFGSNDDWLVTPDEIAAALAAYRKHDPQRVDIALTEAGIDDRDYWDRWIGYLTRAQGQGGFRVG